VAEFHLPEVIGHRGAAAYAPENTLDGIREANRRGARWVEFDAKLTSDGVVVLMHDDTLDRTTSGHGPVAEASYAYISGLDAGVWFGADWRGARVPTLADALALIVELDMGANIEIKPCPARDRETAEAVVEVTRRGWPGGRPRPLLSSFSRDSLAAARDRAPDMPRGLLVWKHPGDWAATAQELGCIAVHCAEQHLTPAWAADIRRCRLGLAVYTVNDPARAVELRSWGAQCIISDRPDAILATT
jgi:glycerophosphoryl diester phosphodiesterase